MVPPPPTTTSTSTSEPTVNQQKGDCAQLDRTATELEQNTAVGTVTAADVSLYEQQAAHARHLLAAAGAEAKDVADAEKAHRGDGERGFATRALDHATHPRLFQTTQPAADSGREHDHDDQEMNL
ncbi:hypothetical protein [Streptomyces mobaraensis]|uniref:Uncharacterized protein n=1 Tax=Streptomyces mobaraensis TaxID=35621 RepID=A0A5N5VXH7_STRMB|nr:hypothetical protein [Streptomyces mobaraensis]KAB7833556.1 hypothetical protein FRZ00_33470 [Streptomyces mobaraensis]